MTASWRGGLDEPGILFYILDYLNSGIKLGCLAAVSSAVQCNEH